MRTFYYVHTGHRIGLDRFRRAAAILKDLDDENITLLCSDFRIAQIAEDFGVKNCVGLDVVRNIPQISHHGDELLFDSDEANPIMLDDMRNYFSTFIKISDDKEYIKDKNELLISPYLEGKEICNAYAIDDIYFSENKKSINISYFFGDDDYEKDLEKNIDILENIDANLQLGFYYFLDYEESLKEKFSSFTEFDEYEEMILKTDILITSSPQAVLESLASSGRPIYLKREDYSDNFDEMFRNLNIPIISNYNKTQLEETVKTINNNKYKKIGQNGNKITKFIKENLNL